MTRRQCVAPEVRNARNLAAAAGVLLASALAASEALAAALPAGPASSAGLLLAFAAWLAAQAAQMPIGASASVVTIALLSAGGAVVVGVWVTRAGAHAVAAFESNARKQPSHSMTFDQADALGRRAVSVELPSGVDMPALLSDLRDHFVRVQTAWDTGQVEDLRVLVTPDMLDHLWDARPGSESGVDRTEVVTLRATLLGLDAVGDCQLAMVEFSGLIRESAQEGAVPFRELWMLARGADASGPWKLARQQALL